MGTATNSTSVLVEQGETVPVYSGEHCSIPSGRLLLYNFYPFPIFVGHWEDRRSGNLGVLQMRCSHRHRPDLCPILPTPKGL